MTAVEMNFKQSEPKLLVSVQELSLRVRWYYERCAAEIRAVRHDLIKRKEEEKPRLEKVQVAEILIGVAEGRHPPARAEPLKKSSRGAIRPASVNGISAIKSVQVHN